MSKKEKIFDEKFTENICLPVQDCSVDYVVLPEFQSKELDKFLSVLDFKGHCRSDATGVCNDVAKP